MLFCRSMRTPSFTLGCSGHNVIGADASHHYETVSELLPLSEGQRCELNRWAQSRTLPAGDVFRARLILALADGWSYSQIKQRLQTTAPTISRWKQRFERDGIAGLDPQHKGSQQRVANAQVQARIARKTQQKPADGSTHWSCRKMAEVMGVSKSTVQRVWAQARLKPHRLERYMASNDPQFEEKVADIIGLYMNPPQHAAVFCVDEKTAIQALDRLDPLLPLSPGRAERHGFEYYRHGTLSLYAALDVKTGKVHGMTGRGIPAWSSSRFCRDWWRERRGPSRSVWCSITFRRTRPRRWNASLRIIRECNFTSRRPIRHGWTRWSCGSPRSSAT